MPTNQSEAAEKTKKTAEQSRKQYKKQKNSAKKEPEYAGTEKLTRKQQKKKQRQEKKMNKRPIRRIFPIWLRIIVIPILCAAALVAGVMVGYGIIGDGSPKDALEFDTWRHIIEIVSKKQ